MKVILLILGFVTSQSALAGTITCTGTADYGVVIHKLEISEIKLGGQVTIDYSIKGKKEATNTYVIDYIKSNGRTDIHKQAQMISGTASGEVDDDNNFSLPHFGQYADGLGSEIGFNLPNGDRAFGVINCQ